MKHTEETKRKISESLRRAIQEGRAKAPVITPEGYARRQEGYNKRLFDVSFEHLSFERKRKRLILEQKNTCAGCNLSEWRGQPITLEVDHKNGIGDDDRRENLEMLCPNCHALTPTWRGRNKPAINSRETNVTDEELCHALRHTSSIRQALLKVGMAAKGNNYVRAKRLNEEIKNAGVTQ